MYFIDSLLPCIMFYIIQRGQYRQRPQGQLAANGPPNPEQKRCRVGARFWRRTGGNSAVGQHPGIITAYSITALLLGDGADVIVSFSYR